MMLPPNKPDDLRVLIEALWHGQNALAEDMAQIDRVLSQYNGKYFMNEQFSAYYDAYQRFQRESEEFYQILRSWIAHLEEALKLIEMDEHADEIVSLMFQQPLEY